MNEIAMADNNGENIADMLHVVDVNSIGIGYIPRSEDIVSRLYINDMDVDDLGKNFIESMTRFINQP